MSKLYFIILVILPIIITNNGLFNVLTDFYHTSKDTLSNDINKLKIKLGLTKKKLILGCIKAIPWKNIRLFFKSLKKANFQNCDVVMFVKDLSKEVQDKFNLYGIIQQEIPDEYKTMAVNDIRFVLYEKFLKDKYKEYNMIIAVDTTDLIFQKDIFQYYKNYKSFLSFAIEDGDLTEESNQRWLLRIYGKEVFESIKNQKIINSGCVIGSSDKFYELTVDMSKELNAKFILNVGVHDQPVLNYFYYHEKKYVNHVIKSDNSGPIMSIGSVKKENLIFDSDDYLLNYKGEIAGIVQQYGRFTNIVKKFNEKYGNLVIKINKENNNKNNLFSIYFIICNFFLFFIYILIIICRYIFILFKPKSKKVINFKNVKIEKIITSQKKKHSKSKYSIIPGFNEYLK